MSQNRDLCPSQNADFSCHVLNDASALLSQFPVPLGDPVQQLELFARPSVTAEENTPISEYYPELNPTFARERLNKI